MTESQLPAPPIARKEHTETRLHGQVLTDDYAWLRDKQNPEVTAYLEAENAYAEAFMAPLAGLREELYQEMLSHVKQTDVSVPYPRRRLVVLHAHGRRAPVRHSLPHPTALRSATEDTPEQVILDGNKLAEGHAFFAIGATDITDDGRWLAYSTDTTGFRQYTLHIKDLLTGETLAGEVERVGSAVWAADNQTLFYTVEDEEQKRQYQLWRHMRGTPHTADVLVYPGRRRALQPGRRPHARRPLHRSGVGQPHHQRVAVFARRQARRRVHAHQSPPG